MIQLFTGPASSSAPLCKLTFSAPRSGQHAFWLSTRSSYSPCLKLYTPPPVHHTHYIKRFLPRQRRQVYTPWLTAPPPPRSLLLHPEHSQTPPSILYVIVHFPLLCLVVWELGLGLVVFLPSHHIIVLLNSCFQLLLSPPPPSFGNANLRNCVMIMIIYPWVPEFPSPCLPLWFSPGVLLYIFHCLPSGYPQLCIQLRPP